MTHNPLIFILVAIYIHFWLVKINQKRILNHYPTNPFIAKFKYEFQMCGFVLAVLCLISSTVITGCYMKMYFYSVYSFGLVPNLLFVLLISSSLGLIYFYSQTARSTPNIQPETRFWPIWFYCIAVILVASLNFFKE